MVLWAGITWGWNEDQEIRETLGQVVGVGDEDPWSTWTTILEGSPLLLGMWGFMLLCDFTVAQLQESALFHSTKEYTGVLLSHPGINQEILTMDGGGATGTYPVLRFYKSILHCGQSSSSGSCSC